MPALLFSEVPMLSRVLVRAHSRYRSLPILGSTLDGFAGWLLGRGYLRYRVRQYLFDARRVERRLWRRGVRSLGDVSREALRACAPRPGHSQEDQGLSAASRSLERYLELIGHLARAPVAPPTRSQRLLVAFAGFLAEIRGLSRSTVGNHVRTACALLDRLGCDADPSRLATLGMEEVESFVRYRGRRVQRTSMQQEVAQLRSFLRFLALRGVIKPGLETQIDTPRVYRGEQLPRALPWETVVRFRRSIDRSTIRGVRDYAIFTLMATYGLRSSEIVGLTLDDVEWRARRLTVRQPKSGQRLVLPLTREVATALIDYLRKGRIGMNRRQVFVSCRVPGGPIGSTAIRETFCFWLRRSGLDVPLQGPHCLRHSYAVHLLRRGIALKTIGDILGHRSAESTCTYLRLAVEDLRAVALPLPGRQRGRR